MSPPSRIPSPRTSGFTGTTKESHADVTVTDISPTTKTPVVLLVSIP